MELARTAIEQTFEEQLVMPHSEIEARLWDLGWLDPTNLRKIHFNPHILTLAQNELERAGRILHITHPTKGGATVDLLSTADTRLRTTAISRAARRKGMLYARYDRWIPTIGDAGEAVVAHSLTEAMRRGDGFMPVNSDGKFGEISRIGTLKFPGPVDNGAWQTVIDPTTRLPLPATHLVLIEMKNRRLTLYPRHAEVHQLLHKAALAVDEFPGLPIVPALICRRGHPWLFWMAKDLGFRVQQTRRQFFTLPDKTDRRYLTEVQEELGFDLHPINGEMPKIIDFFKGVLPKEAATAAQRWKLMAPLVKSYSEELRKDTLAEYARTQLLHEMYLDVELVMKHSSLGEPATWTLPPEDAREDPTFL
ncbi:hypothetical protein [Amycolatopsis eburnea]|uniref:Uncharacterized protein n=1 Tax=Amycolatopsis eburnea TaxID=2267691 RepID=A0A427TPV5_9PSEU|nr:hypothetical protein [Amycolatopsis eburnea]RSD26415.1 hypothetical protein EIY87_00045 [Amycolatopsis eburnea]